MLICSLMGSRFFSIHLFSLSPHPPTAPLTSPRCSHISPWPTHHSSVKRSNKLILKIMTNSPIVTIIISANPNQPNIIAAVPTPLFTLPFPRSCAMVLAATDAVCCHSTETSTNIEATKINARAICETGREGKGLTSRSEPCSSISSCQPGKVARRRKQTKARTMATILVCTSASWYGWRRWRDEDTHIRYGNTMLSLKVFATHIKFSGS